jgi:hypothetical protein
MSDSRNSKESAYPLKQYSRNHYVLEGSFSRVSCKYFFYSYIQHKEVGAFYTGSLAEYHRHHLRIVFANYVKALTHVDQDLHSNILTDDNDL